jgi:hypothetical protein
MNIYSASKTINGNSCTLWVQESFAGLYEICFQVNGSYDAAVDLDKETKRAISGWFRYQIIIKLPTNCGGKLVIANLWDGDDYLEKRKAFFRSLPGWEPDDEPEIIWVRQL